jgi:hypothetical protein
VIEAGYLKPIVDLTGVNAIRFDGSSTAVKKLLERLKMVGCPVDDSGDDWLDMGRFSGLATGQDR